MREASPNVPALSVLQRALRKTTETLAREIARPGPAVPDWSGFEWHIARAVVAIHGVSPLFAGALRWHGPSQWEEFLQDQRAQTAARHARIEELLCRIDCGARRAGIAAVALKGAELHAIGLYRPGERPMGDVDLLVRNADMDVTTRMLEAQGFRASYATWKHRVFVPQNPRPARASLGEDADNDLKIELHERIHEALPVCRQDVTAHVMPRQSHPGLNRYPSTVALMIHLLLHAAGAIALRNLRLLQLHDIALLGAGMTSADWNQLLDDAAAGGRFWWAWPPLALTARYYPDVIPDGALAALHEQCPRLLRSVARRQSLSDVSLSYLPVGVFPGIEWSHSLHEALGYALRRVVPNRETLAARITCAPTRGAGAENSWDQLPQWRRILRWLAAPQPRIETLAPIRVALLGAQGSSEKVAS